jgi:hypothetical protein
MQSKARTAAEYLAELPEDRRQAVAAVRDVVLANLDKDFEEGMGYGMLGWYVPHSVFPAGYHTDPRQPLPFAGIASQKNYMSLYLTSAYYVEGEESWFRDAWAKTGKKLDMGKSCIRFRKVDDLALDVIAEAIRRVTAKQHIEAYLARIPARARATAEAAPKRRPEPKAKKKTATRAKKPMKAKKKK